MSAQRFDGLRRVAGLNRVSTGDLVAARIRSMVLDGTLRPGDRLLQDALAQELGVSRIPVREAFIALDREGWVTSTHKRGTFVESFDDEAIRVHFEVQGVVCALAARRASTRASVEDLVRLRHAQEQVLTCSSPADLQDAQEELLEALLSAARSPRLAIALRGASSLIAGNPFEIIPGFDELQREGCRRITSAIGRRDEHAASDASLELAGMQADIVIHVLRVRGVLPTPVGATATDGTSSSSTLTGRSGGPP